MICFRSGRLKNKFPTPLQGIIWNKCCIIKNFVTRDLLSIKRFDKAAGDPYPVLFEFDWQPEIYWSIERSIENNKSMIFKVKNLDNSGRYLYQGHKDYLFWKFIPFKKNNLYFFQLKCVYDDHHFLAAGTSTKMDASGIIEHSTEKKSKAEDSLLRSLWHFNCDPPQHFKCPN